MTTRTIKIAVDSSLAVKGATQVEKSLNRVARAMRDIQKMSGKSFSPLSQSSDALGRSFNNTAASTKKLNKSLSDSEKQVKALEKAAIIIQGPLGGFAARVSAVHSSMTLANGSIASQVALVGALSGASVALVKYGEQYTRLANRVKAFATEGQDVPRIFSRLTDAANKARVPVENLVDIYSKVAQAKNVLDISTEAAIKFSQTVSQAATLSGSTLQSQQAALYQFGQAISTNFQNAGQEIASIREQAPVLAKAIEEGINKLEGLSGQAYLSLKQLAEAELISTQRVNDAIIIQRKSIQDNFNAMDVTVSNSLTILNNNLLRYFGTLNQSTKATSVLAKAIVVLGENIDTIIESLAVAVASGLGIWLTTVATAAKNTQMFSAAQEVLAATTKSTTVVTAGLNTALGMTPVKASLATKAAEALQSVFMWFKANPLALIFIAAGSAIAYMASEANKAEKEMRGVRDAYKDFYSTLEEARNAGSFQVRESLLDQAQASLKEELKLTEDLTAKKKQLKMLESQGGEGGLSGRAQRKKAIEDLRLEINVTTSRLAEMQKKIDEVNNTPLKPQVSLGATRDDIRKLQKTLRTELETVGEQIQSQKDALKILNDPKDIAIANDNLKRLETKKTEILKKAHDAQLKEIEAFNRKQEQLTEKAKRIREGLTAEYESIFDSVATPQERYNKEIRQLEDFKARYIAAYGAISEEQQAVLTRVAEKAAMDRDEQLNGTKELAKGMKETMQEVANDIRDSFKDAFVDIFTTGKLNFSKLGKSIKSIIANVFAQMATQAVTKSVIAPLVSTAGSLLGVNQSIIGGVNAKLGAPNAGGFSLGNAGSIFNVGKSLLGGGGMNLFGGTGIGSSINSFGAKYLGTGNMWNASGNAIGSAGTTLGTALSGAAIGAGIGSLNLFGGKQTGSTIGGAVGGLAGSFIPIPVVGTLLGSAVGSAIGGLFGASAPTSASEFAGTVGTSGILKSTFGSKNADPKIAKTISASVGQITEFLTGIGADLSGVSLRGGLNTKQKGGGFFDIGDRTIKFNVEDADAVNQALVDLTKEFSSLADISNMNLKTALQNIQTEGRDVSEILSDLGFAASLENLSFANDNTTAFEQSLKDLNQSYTDAIKKANELGLAEKNIIQARDDQLTQLRFNFNKSVRVQILEYTDPTAAALKGLTEAFVELRRNAFATGGNLAEVEKLFGLKRQEILEQSVDAQTSVLQEQLDRISDFRNSLMLNRSLTAGSYLSIQQESERQFNTLAARIAAGDAGALEDIQDVSSKYLEASLNYFGPTEKYLSRLEQVYQLLDNSEGLAHDTYDVNDAILDENQKQTELLTHLLDKYETGSDNIMQLSSITAQSLLRSGESLSKLQQVDPVTGLSQQLTRSLKVLASDGNFDFNAGITFADFVRRGNTSAGKDYLGLLEMFGGSGITDLRQRFGFFANGTGNSTFSGLGIVGERGPELVNFSKPAQIFSSGDSGGLASLAEVPQEIREQTYQMSKELQMLRREVAMLKGSFENLGNSIELQARL